MTDVKKEPENLELIGVRLCFKDVRVTIRRAGGANVAFIEDYVRTIQQFRLAIAANVCSDEAIIRATAGVYSRTIIQLVEFPAGAKKAPLENPKEFEKWLLDDQEAFADVIAYAEDWKTFSLKSERREEANMVEEAA